MHTGTLLIFNQRHLYVWLYTVHWFLIKDMHRNQCWTVLYIHFIHCWFLTKDTRTSVGLYCMYIIDFVPDTKTDRRKHRYKCTDTDIDQLHSNTDTKTSTDDEHRQAQIHQAWLFDASNRSRAPPRSPQHSKESFLPLACIVLEEQKTLEITCIMSTVVSSTKT